MSYQIFQENVCNRDLVFQTVLGLLPRELNILEIGTIRNGSIESRRADGWSSFHFLDHILDFGGSLTICDVSQGAIDCCRQILETHPLYKNATVNFICDGGLNQISDKYNFIYLDGSDNPEEMAQEFNKAADFEPILLCDDFHSKGTITNEICNRNLRFIWKNNPHQMAVYGLGYGILVMPDIQNEQDKS